MTDNIDTTVQTGQDGAQVTAQTVSEREQFLSSLPEEYRADPTFARFNNWGDVAKSYASAAKMVGMDKSHVLALPRDDNEEAWGPVYDKLGRPESAEKYNIGNFKDHIPEEDLKPYAEVAHSVGLNNKQFDAFVGKFSEQVSAAKAQQLEQMQNQVNQWQQEVKQEFGAAYDQKIAFAQKAVEKFGLADMIKGNEAIFENPAFVKAMVEIGEKTSEGITLANGDVAHGALSPNEAKMELSKFQSDPENVKIMLDKRHPQHDFIMKRRSELFAYAYQG